jgi:hypothetical protein
MNTSQLPPSPELETNFYTGGHNHPVYDYKMDFVAYERFDKKHDLYIFSNEYLNDELEKNRVDNLHVFIKTIDSINKEMEMLCEEVMEKLGEDFQVVPYYREINSRVVCGRIVDYLRSINSQGMHLHSDNNIWTLEIRKKDFRNASVIASSNI